MRLLLGVVFIGILVQLCLPISQIYEKVEGADYLMVSMEKRSVIATHDNSNHGTVALRVCLNKKTKKELGVSLNILDEKNDVIVNRVVNISKGNKESGLITIVHNKLLPGKLYTVEIVSSCIY